MKKISKGFTSISIDRLTKAKWNYKQEDETLARKLQANIKKNGQVENIVVREIPDGSYEIVNGNHRFDALVNLGMLEAFVFNLGVIDDEDAKLIAIETNETKFATDWTKLSDVLMEITGKYSVNDLLETLPYSQSELDRFLKMASEEFSQSYENDEISFDEQQKYKLVIVFDNENDFLACQKAVNNLQPTPALGLKELLNAES